MEDSDDGVNDGMRVALLLERDEGLQTVRAKCAYLFGRKQLKNSPNPAIHIQNPNTLE
jgi:hypothetical protein